MAETHWSKRFLSMTDKIDFCTEPYIYLYICLLLFSLITGRHFIIDLPGYLPVFFQGPVFPASWKLLPGYLPALFQFSSGTLCF